MKSSLEKELALYTTGAAKDLQPDWVSAPTAVELKADLTEALTHHSTQTSKVDEWLDNLNITGKAAVDKKTGRSSIVPKLIRKHAEWRYASISEPLHTASTLFTVQPVGVGDSAIARQDGLLLAHQFENNIDKVALIDELVRTGTDEGTAVIRTGWHLTTRKETVTVIVARNGIPMLRADGSPVTAEQEQEVTVESYPTAEIVPYRSFILDPNARGVMKDAQFAIFKFPTNISKLKAEGYENLDAINLSNVAQYGAEASTDSRQDTHFNLRDEARKEFTAYEYWGFWDINDDHVLVPIVATFVGDIMVRLRENPFPDGQVPFTMIHHLPVRKSNTGEPDSVLIEDNQKIGGALTRGMLDTLGRSAAGQIGYASNALDFTNQQKFERGEDYQFRDGTPAQELFHNHTYPELSASGFNLLQMNAGEAESMTGVMTFGEGVSGSSLGETAAGVNGTLSAAAKRESGILRRYAKGLTDVAIKIASMNEVFLDVDQIERITGEAYVEPQIGARTTDIRVKVRTAEQDNQLASDLAFIGQTTEDPGLRQILTAKVADLKNMPDIAQAIREYKPDPDPLAQQLQQLQIQLLQAQIANEQGKAHNNMSSGILDTAKSNTEVAKAANIEADTERKKLEYVEEELGVNHERQVDLQTKQAEGNMRYAALQAQLETIKPTETTKK